MRGNIKPDNSGEYLVKCGRKGFMVAKFDGEFWEEKVERLVCWTLIPKCDTSTPF